MSESELTNLLYLNLSNPHVADCLERLLQVSEFRYGSTGVISLKHVIETCSRREVINSKLNNGIIEGYDTLLLSLKAATVSAVRLQSLEFLSHWFILFTNESTSHLYGILKSPKKKAAWFNPITGYD